MSKFKVCVYCTAYNHEKYIRKTLEGFVNQKTDFDFYCIVHDDASTDNTASIIREYESKYPNLIKGIYQKENQYSKKINIVERFISPKVDSDYVAICEGDDYWIDNLKLQRQVDALESHKDCYMCVHKTREVYEDERATGITYPKENYEEGCLNIENLLSNDYCIHTSSYMFVSEKWLEFIQNPPEFKRTCDVGDVPYFLYFGYLGNIYYISNIMSCYRRGVPTSWSASRANLKGGKLIENLASHAWIMFCTYTQYNDFTQYIFNDICLGKSARCFLQYNTLRKTNVNFFRCEYLKYFMKLDLPCKSFVVLSLLFPSIMKKWYLNRLDKLNKAKMGI